MMADPACIAHAAGRNDHLRRRIAVEPHGFLTGSREFKVFKIQRVVTLCYVGLRFIIEYLCISFEHFSRCSGHRAVHVYHEIFKVLTIFAVAVVDPVKFVNQLLGTTYCKGWDHGSPAAFRCITDNVHQPGDIQRIGWMHPVAVCCFHDHIVGFFDDGRVSQDRSVHNT